MIIDFKDVSNRNTWLHRILLNCVSVEAIDRGRESGTLDVKIMINGIEHDAEMLNDLCNNVEKFIDQEAAHLSKEAIKDKLYSIHQAQDKLDDIIKEAVAKIKQEFKIEDDE